MVVFEEHLLTTKPFDIICYGIGSVQKSKNAQYQFELALILRELLKVLIILNISVTSILIYIHRFLVKCIYLIQS